MKNQTLTYQNTPIQFVATNSDIMVNATQMAKIFGKMVEPFTRNENTQKFINECLKSENSRYLNVKNESDLIDSRQKSGTFMHRILALKFAAWLDPSFELWVFSTIDHLLMGHYRDHYQCTNEVNKLKKAIEQEQRNLSSNPDFANLTNMQFELKRALNRRRSAIITANTQLSFNINN